MRLDDSAQNYTVGGLRFGGRLPAWAAKSCRAGGSCWSALHSGRRACFRLAGYHRAGAARAHRRVGHHDRRAPDRGRDPVAQGNRRRVAAGVERPPLDPLRRCPGCPAQPSAGAVAVVWMIASFAIVVGCVYIALAFSPEAVQIAGASPKQCKYSAIGPLIFPSWSYTRAGEDGS